MKIFHNAVVYTGENFTHAFALEDGRFAAVGDEALALEGERIDLGGAFVCTGFNDSHMHLLNYGQALSMAPLAAHTGSLEDMVDCLKNTRPDQLRRIADRKLHIYAQSIFLDYDVHIVHQRAGNELAASSYSWKTLLELGSTVSNGSDCPVAAPDVMAGIQCAVTRSDLHGCAPYLPQEAFTVQEALDSFTKAGAYASFEENIKGQIKPGHLSDFVILGENPFLTPPDKLKDIPILQTWLNGERVW